MVATSNGIDGRLLEAARALLAGGRGTPDGRPMSLPEFLSLRCRELLAACPTSIGDDERLLRQLEGGAGGAAAAAAADVRPEQLQTAVRYRLCKKRVLQATLDALQGA